MQPRLLAATLLGSAFLAGATGCGGDGTAPPISPAWHKHAANPVLAAGPSGSWDELGVGAPYVLARDPHSYVMWYSGLGPAGTQIGVATSDDGIVWVKDARNPVFGFGSSGAWDAEGVGDPCVLFDGASYSMYYAGGRAPAREIGVATSSDGIVWSRAAAEPVLGPSTGPAWDDRETFTPWVTRDGSGFTMWYGALGSSGFRATGRATSADGINWTRSLAPVLDPQVLEAICIDPCVLVSSGSYRLWCVAWHETTGGRSLPAVIDFAHSADGVEWSRNELALAPSPGTAWDSGELRGVCVRDEGGVSRMWYQGEAPGLPSAIGLATRP